MQSIRFHWCFLVCTALVTLGCSAEAERAPVYPVMGTVTLNGVPLDGAVVTYSPVEDGKSATGITDANGQYELTTWAAGDGATAGQYKVTVTKYGSPPGGVAEEAPSVEPNYDAEEFDEYPADYDEMEESEVAAATATNILPPKYADPNTSGFEVEVVAGENAPANFSLEG